MRGREIAYLAVASLLFQGRASWAATSACSAGAQEARQEPVASVVRTLEDPGTGGAIRLEREASGRVIVEFESGTVSVRKELGRRSSVTTFVFGNQRTVLALVGDALTVTTSDERSLGTVSHPETLVDALALLRRSTAAQAARDVLNRAALRPDSLEGNALLLTRALLGSIGGDDTSTWQFQRWTTEAARRSRVVRAALNDGPGPCWDAYSREAIRIADDYMECGNSCNWSGYICMLSCGTLYDIRSEGAFLWYINCSSQLSAGG